VLIKNATDVMTANITGISDSHLLILNTLIHIPATNHISYESKYANATGITNPPLKKINILMQNTTVNPIYAVFFPLNTGVIKNIRNKQYKYQYGAIGTIKSECPSPPTFEFTASGNTVFKHHVIVENVKYGTPRANNFFKMLSLQAFTESTLLYL
jgi:hypothetical protein